MTADIFIGQHPATPVMCAIEATIHACAYPRITPIPFIGYVGLPKNAPTPDPGSVTVRLLGIPVGGETSFTTLPAPSSYSTSLEDGWNLRFRKDGRFGEFTFTERVAV